MRVSGADGAAHLTHCTHIRPGESWPDIRHYLETYCAAVRARIAPGRPAGVGLRLSAAAATALSRLEVLRELLELLREQALYVLTIDGVAYGAPDGRVKEDLFLPDWRSQERLEYTNRLAELLAVLLPEGVRGSIVTVPGAYRQAIATRADKAAIAARLAQHVAHLVDIKRRSGRVIRTALEPEPCFMIETLAEAVRFFEGYALSREARELLAREGDLSLRAAEAALREHLGVCVDLCHAALVFEDVKGALAALQAAGIAVPKVQISAALRLPQVTQEDLERLRAFDDAVCLRQVVARTRRGLRRYGDLAQAFAAFDPRERPCEWRVGLHVPVHLSRMDAFETTRESIETALESHRAAPITDHFEVETHTFEVLPSRYRDADAVTQIAREVRWAAQQLRA